MTPVLCSYIAFYQAHLHGGAQGMSLLSDGMSSYRKIGNSF